MSKGEREQIAFASFSNKKREKERKNQVVTATSVYRTRSRRRRGRWRGRGREKSPRRQNESKSELLVNDPIVVHRANRPKAMTFIILECRLDEIRSERYLLTHTPARARSICESCLSFITVYLNAIDNVFRCDERTIV